MFGIFGKHGAYRMPHTPEFETRADAMAYRNLWWPDNRSVVVAYIHTGFEAGAL